MRETTTYRRVAAVAGNNGQRLMALHRYSPIKHLTRRQTGRMQERENLRRKPAWQNIADGWLYLNCQRQNKAHVKAAPPDPGLPVKGLCQSIYVSNGLTSVA
jgi:hypothetical protein